MKNQLSFEEAKRLSIIKWEAIIEQEGILINVPEEIKGLRSHCGFCQRHMIFNDPINDKNCINCELGKIAMPCTQENSVYDLWYQANRRTNKIQFAKQLLEVIKSLKENS